MKEETIEKLAIAAQFLHSAQFAGTARQAVADSYSAIDSIFSALLLDLDKEPSRNHKQKFNKVKEIMPRIFEERTEKHGEGISHMSGVGWEEIEEHYDNWLVSRYEEFDMRPNVAKVFLSHAHSVLNLSILYLEEKYGDDLEDLEGMINRRAYGYDYSEVNRAVGEAHDRLFHEAEVHGEQIGSKLGTKIGAATNFCDVDFISSDELTQGIIATDPVIADHAARVYIGFVNLAEEIREKRFDLLKAESGLEEIEAGNTATEFMLSLKACYHGESMEATADNLVTMLGRLFSKE